MPRSNISGNPSDPRHGSANAYNNLSCHCDRCKAAWAKTKRAYMHSHPEQRAAHALRRKNHYKRRKEQINE